MVKSAFWIRMANSRPKGSHLAVVLRSEVFVQDVGTKGKEDHRVAQHHADEDEKYGSNVGLSEAVDRVEHAGACHKGAHKGKQKGGHSKT